VHSPGWLTGCVLSFYLLLVRLYFGDFRTLYTQASHLAVKADHIPPGVILNLLADKYGIGKEIR
jgi:hypothetical protein